MDQEIQKQIQKETEDLTEERNARCVPCANDLRAIIAKGRIDSEPSDELFDEYKPLHKEAVELFMAHNIKLSEVHYVFQLVRTGTDMLFNSVSQSLQKNVQLLEEKKFGQLVDDMSVQDLDVLLKE
jgi:hypothetical protein